MTGAVDTVLCGVVGREPAIEWVVDAFRDAIVPIWNEIMWLCKATISPRHTNWGFHGFLQQPFQTNACYVYVFLLLCMLCSAYSVCIVPTGTLWLPWLRVFHAFSWVVSQMPQYNLQRWGTTLTLPS